MVCQKSNACEEGPLLVCCKYFSGGGQIFDTRRGLGGVSRLFVDTRYPHPSDCSLSYF